MFQIIPECVGEQMKQDCHVDYCWSLVMGTGGFITLLALSFVFDLDVTKINPC